MGEVEMVEFVPWRNLPYVQTMKDVKIVRRGAPTLCLLQLNFNREAMRSPDLRRALVYALDRRKVIDRVGAAEDKEVKLLNGPVAVDGFGYNSKIADRANDTSNAKVLVKAVEKNLKSLPPLTLAHQGNESTRLACDEIAKQLRNVGLQVTVVEVDERSPDPRQADLRFQTVAVSDPIFDLVTVLTRDNPSLFENAGPRLRQLLIQLLQVPNATVAKALLPDVHQALHEEISMIPLWQWHETFLASSGVLGLSPAPATFYQGVSDWQAKPRYPPANWETKPVARMPADADNSRVALRENRLP
jgi:ABC-type transport system substrate-binding protein